MNPCRYLVRTSISLLCFSFAIATSAEPPALSISPSEPGESGGRFVPWAHRSSDARLGASVQNLNTGLSFADLQSAIDDAGTLAGDTLEVIVPELVEGQVSVTKSLTLQGPSASTTIKMAEDTGSSGDTRAWFWVAPGVDLTVRDLTFDGNGFKVHQAFRHRGAGLFENVSFHDIQFNPSGPEYAGTAIVAFGGRVDVRDSSFTDIGRVGVLAFGSGMNGAEIINNVYEGKGNGNFLDYGFEVGAGAIVTLRDNTVFDCLGTASDGSSSAGILVTTASAPGTTVTAIGNTMVGNTTGLRIGNTGDTSVVAAHHNRILSNDYGAFSFSPTVKIEDNWWGCNEGPGAVDCDSAGGSLDSDPWLTLSLQGPEILPPSSSAAVHADLRVNSDGVDTLLQGTLPDGMLATFGAGPGTMSPTVASTVDAAASSTFTAAATSGTATVCVNVDNETVCLNIDVSAAAGPTLNIPSLIPARSGSKVAVPIELINGGNIAAVSFSVNSDETCLTFDDSDSDNDGIPDDAVFEVAGLPDPPVFGMTYDAGDTGSEFQFFIADFGTPPLTPLPSGTLITLYFTVTCNPPTGGLEAPVLFADDPTASFGDVNGQSVAGTVSHGSVFVYGGLPGDCNDDGVVDAGDLAACPLEIFDGDGSFWADAGGGSFVGSPVGCDANEDNTIDSGDSSCKVLLIFNGPGACAPPVNSFNPSASLSLSNPVPAHVGETVTVTLRLEHDAPINSLAISLDFDESYLELNPTDGDGDGIPDAVTLHVGSETFSDLSLDLEDASGEIDLSLMRPFSTLPQGLLLSLKLKVLAMPPDETAEILFSTEPLPSFGNLDGSSMTGTWQGSTVSVPTGLIFADDFESSNLQEWQLAQP